jgi:hypothetical protein
MVLDTSLLDYFKSEKLPYLDDMRNTIQHLADADMIAFVDYGERSQIFQGRLLQKVEEYLEYPIPWLLILRKAIKIHKPLAEAQLNIIGDYADVANESLTYSVMVYKKMHPNRADGAMISRLQSYISSKKRNYSAGEEDEIRELVRPMVTQAAFSKFLSMELELPYLDWEDMEPFISRMTIEKEWGREPKAVTQNQLEAAQAIFSASMPALAPQEPAEVVRFLKRSSAVKSFRATITDALSKGEKFDARWAEEVYLDASNAHIIDRKKQNKFKWISFGASFVPIAAHLVPQGAALLENAGILETFYDPLKEVVLGAAEEKNDRKDKSSFEWFYTLVESRSLRGKSLNS